MFTICINYIFNFVHHSSLYNYADDNILPSSHKDSDVVKQNLEADSIALIQWFLDNNMQANPDKLQAISVGRKTKDSNIDFNIDNFTIQCDEEVKLLGVTIDFRLHVYKYVSNICKKKVSRQLNVLKRIWKYLCKLGKLNIYYSFILSNFNYCPLTWHFCSETNTKNVKIFRSGLYALSIMTIYQATKLCCRSPSCQL